MTTFSGFPRQAPQFLLNLRHNNNREWFKAHKADFDAYVTAPAKSFAAALAPKLAEALSTVGSDQPVQHSIFRIYRDTRFSPDKTPYKTHLGVWFWQGERPRMENSGFYFHLEPPQLMLATGVYIFPKPLLEAYRQAVVNPEQGPALLEAVQASGDYPVGGKHYKRTPRGFDPEHERAEWLLYNGLYASTEDLIPEALYSAELIDFCLAHYTKMFPLHLWLHAMISQAGGEETVG